jgi:hypothetical protein
MEFLELHSLTSLFDSIVTMEDAPLKPSPERIHLAMRQVGGQRAIKFGDTKVFHDFLSLFTESLALKRIYAFRPSSLTRFRRTTSYPPRLPVKLVLV